MGEGDRAIQAWSVTLSQSSKSATAPFDAALPYTTAAALSLAIGCVTALPVSFRLGMPAVLMAAALGQALAAHVTRERLRAQADTWIADHSSPSPPAFAWRVDELIDAEREVVGRTLLSFAEELMRARRLGAPKLNRLQLRTERELIFKVAQALQDPSRKVSPRAIVRSRLLITDCGSPLNCSAHHDELHQALQSILADFSDTADVRVTRSRTLDRERIVDNRTGIEAVQ
jgi:hypothetical protein